ncbi:MAG: hypothetical protein AAFY36_08665 [Bacteroidota bacterium]
MALENYTVKNGLANDFALSICCGYIGVLWFGMVDRSVYWFNDGFFEKQS